MKPIICTILLLILSYAGIYAQNNNPPVFQLSADSIDQVIDHSFLQVLPDADVLYSIDSVIKAPLANQFKPLDGYIKTNTKKYNRYWIRFSIKNTSQDNKAISLASGAYQANFYIIDSAGSIAHYKTGYGYSYHERNGLKGPAAIPITLLPGKTIIIYYNRYSKEPGIPPQLTITLLSTAHIIARELGKYEEKYFSGTYFFEACFFGILMLAAIFNFFFYLFVKEKVYLFFSVFLITFAVSDSITIAEVFFSGNYFIRLLLFNIIQFSLAFLVLFVRAYFKTLQASPRWDKVLIVVASLLFLQFILNMFGWGDNYLPQLVVVIPLLLAIIALFATMLMMRKKAGTDVKYFLIAIAPFIVSLFLLMTIAILSSVLPGSGTGLLNSLSSWVESWGDKVVSGCVCWAVIAFSLALFNRYTVQRRAIAQQLLDKERMAKEREIERNQLIAEQKLQLEKDVAERTAELQQSLEELKAAQKQLIQSEKMASLGELTAGIAHEIQNPLNFVNNFSEVSIEMAEELKEEMSQINLPAENKTIIDELVKDLIENQRKINYHGKRADSIVKGMLQHSRSGSTQKEPTNINALADEFLRLSYHGFRAKDKSFNANLETHFDETLPLINIKPQDIGRVLLNLFTNAFYSVMQKKKKVGPGYNPSVIVTTSRSGASLIIKVKDNGVGIPQSVIDKIYNPFFTTKPTGEGTGLGLSLSYDIITNAHAGTIKVNTKENEFAEFTITLPFAQTEPKL